MPVAANQLLTAEIVLQGAIAAAGGTTQRTFSIFHYRRLATVSPVDKSALKTVFLTAIMANYAACLNLRWAATGITIRMMEDVTDLATFFADTTIGGRSGDSLQPHVTGYLLKRTNRRGPRYRGNLKLSPMSEGDTTLGTEDIFNTAALGRLQTLANAMATDMIDATPNRWTPVIVSRRNSDLTIVPATIGAEVVTSVTVRKSLGRLKNRATSSVY